MESCGRRQRYCCYWRVPSPSSPAPLSQLVLVLVLIIAAMEKMNTLGVVAVMTVLDPDGFPLLLSPGVEDHHHPGRSNGEDSRTYRIGGGGLQRVDLAHIVRFRCKLTMMYEYEYAVDSLSLRAEQTAVHFGTCCALYRLSVSL